MYILLSQKDYFHALNRESWRLSFQRSTILKYKSKKVIFHLCQNEKNVYLMVLRVTVLVFQFVLEYHIFSFFHESFSSWQLVKDCCAKKMGVVNLVAPEVKRIVMQTRLNKAGVVEKKSCKKELRKTDYWLECCRLADEIILI